VRFRLDRLASAIVKASKLVDARKASRYRIRINGAVVYTIGFEVNQRGVIDFLTGEGGKCAHNSAVRESHGRGCVLNAAEGPYVRASKSSANLC